MILYIYNLDRASIPPENEANFEIGRHFEVTTMAANGRSAKPERNISICEVLVKGIAKIKLLIFGRIDLLLIF